jgi:hypothetical protein
MQLQVVSMQTYECEVMGMYVRIGFINGSEYSCNHFMCLCGNYMNLDKKWDLKPLHFFILYLSHHE